MNHHPSLLFILSGNLSTTPRALHAIRLASSTYQVHILCIDRAARWSELDRQLVNQYRLDLESIPLKRNTSFRWLFCKAIHICCSGGSALLPRKSSLPAAFASSLAAVLLWHRLRSWKEPVDLVLGFSYGSLFPVWYAARRWQVPFTMDVEDYYPGEFIAGNDEAEKKRREYLLSIILPDADLLTYSSPLTGKEVKKLLPDRQPQKELELLNSFPSKEFEPETDSQPGNMDLPVRLLWFSQNISHSRGLELIIEAVEEIHWEAKNNQLFQLTLIGAPDLRFDQEWNLSGRSWLVLLDPLPADKLHKRIAGFDAGLALEPGSDFNNRIAVSNKIIAYCQAGTYILATDTPGQKLFMEEDPGRGMLCRADVKSMSQGLRIILDEREKIREARSVRLLKARSLAWENRAPALEIAWKEILGS